MTDNQMEKLQTAKKAYEERDFITAKNTFEQISHVSDEATYYLAGMYRLGLGVDKNYARAIELYENAMKKGNSDAKACLGLMHVMGQGMPRNVKHGHKMLEDARYEGSIVALDNLGMMYESGIGVPKDIDKAIKYYNSAEELGSEASTYNLGRMFYFGTDVEKNVNKAVELLKRSRKKAESAYLLAMMRIRGEIEEEDIDGMELLRYASKSGCSAAMCQLGLILYHGKSGVKDEIRGRKYIERAAKLGNKKAIELLKTL